MATDAIVLLERLHCITLIELETQADVDGIDDTTFQKYAEQAEHGCPVSVALAAVPMKLVAKLVH